MTLKPWLRRVPALATHMMILLLCGSPAFAAEPVTITFEDIFHLPMNRDSLPDFKWRGVEFGGGSLRRSTSPSQTWYRAFGRNAIEMQFPPGATNISFEVDGYGSSIILFEHMNVRVWAGPVGSGTLVATIPRSNPPAALVPPRHKIVVPGSPGLITIFTAPPPSGVKDYGNLITLDNVRYTPADPEPAFGFDFSPTASVRVLTHNYGDYPYPSSLQTEDSKIRVEGTVTFNGQPAGGKTIHFRLVDPEDTAAYVQSAGDAHLGDNVDGPGSLNGSATATAVSDASGRVSVTLGVSSYAAGDNYRIEASPNPSFSCGTQCPTSALYTAWKRVYVEVNKMFRRGAFLTDDVVPGAKKLSVADVRPFPPEPFRVRLIHGPRPGSNQTTFHSEEVTVVRVEGRRKLFPFSPQPGRLYLDANPDVAGVQHAYDAPHVIFKTDNKVREAGADAVGLVTGNRADDYYLVDARLVAPLYESAFTEHIWLTDATPADKDLAPTQPRMFYDGAIPFVPVLNEDDKWQREWMTRKWASNVTRGAADLVAKPNHHVLFTSSRLWYPPGGQTQYAETSVGGGFNDLWMYLDHIPAGVEPEAIVHELAHEWKVNASITGPPVSGGHCDHALGAVQKMIADQSAKCTMTSDMYKEPAASDGIVGFHYVRPPGGGGVHSEFLRIRWRQEPVPQSDYDRKYPK